MIPYKDLTYQQKVKIALKLKDTASFFVAYFELLPEFGSHRTAFEYLNNIYLDIYEVEKYSSFDSFRQVMYRDGKNYLKKRN